MYMCIVYYILFCVWTLQYDFVHCVLKFGVISDHFVSALLQKTSYGTIDLLDGSNCPIYIIEIKILFCFYSLINVSISF